MERRVIILIAIAFAVALVMSIKSSFGIVWVFVARAESAVARAWLTLGVLTVVVGLISL
jgi:hypothetical protein